MKKIIVIMLILFANTVLADKYVNGYTRSDGTQVQGYNRSSPDSYRSNNYGSQSYGGNQRDEYSNPGATNKSNPSFGTYDNDNDGAGNSYDRNPNNSNRW